MDELEFGLFLRMAREESGISTRKLSVAVDKTTSYVSQVERGVIKKPDYETATKLLRTLGFENDKIPSLLLEFKISNDSFKQKETNKAQYDKGIFKKKLNNFYLNEVVREKHQWFDNKEIETLNDANHEIFSVFIQRDYSRAKAVINNIHQLLNSEVEDFDFFCDLFENNFKTLPNKAKREIITTIKNLIKEGEKQK